MEKLLRATIRVTLAFESTMRSAPRTRWFSIILCLFWTFPVFADVQVNESEMQAAISEKQITLRFPVLNDVSFSDITFTRRPYGLSHGAK